MGLEYGLLWVMHRWSNHHTSLLLVHGINWTELRCIALHCVALHCTALHCTALRCIALHCVALHCTALHCTALRCIALHCNAMQCKQVKTLHCASLLPILANSCNFHPFLRFCLGCPLWGLQVERHMLGWGGPNSFKLVQQASINNFLNISEDLLILHSASPPLLRFSL